MALFQKASSDEMKDIAARICRDYLNGTWKTMTGDDIKLKRISGGLSNFLYYVSLPDNYCDNNNSLSSVDQQSTKPTTKRVRKDSSQSMAEPKEVLLRIYGQTHGEHALETMLTESVVFTLLSERNLGPKLHGIFPGGRIEQYIPARSLITSELSDYKISRKIAEKMAEIHSLDIPVSKEPDWLWNSMGRWLKTIETILKDVSNDENHSFKSQIQEIRKTNLKKEVAWLRTIIENGDFRVVFCHNDLQEGNILLKQDKSALSSIENLSNEFEDSASIDHSYSEVHTSRELPDNDMKLVNGISRKRSLLSHDDSFDIDDNHTRDSVLSTYSDDDLNEPELMIIDYEYCAYNYRAFDLANHFLEWSFDYTNDKYPYFHHKKEQYPTEEQRNNFMYAYLKRLSDYMDYEPTDDDIQELNDEIRVLTMVSHLFWCLWSIVNVHQNIEFGYWDYAICRLREYHLSKENYLAYTNGNTIKDE